MTIDEFYKMLDDENKKISLQELKETVSNLLSAVVEELHDEKYKDEILFHQYILGQVDGLWKCLKLLEHLEM